MCRQVNEFHVIRFGYHIQMSNAWNMPGVLEAILCAMSALIIAFMVISDVECDEDSAFLYTHDDSSINDTQMYALQHNSSGSLADGRFVLLILHNLEKGLTVLSDRFETE